MFLPSLPEQTSRLFKAVQGSSRVLKAGGHRDQGLKNTVDMIRACARQLADEVNA